MRKRANRDLPSRVRLTDCTNCKQPFVNPIMDECREVGDTHWHLALRCGHCFDVRETMVTQAEADLFEKDLDNYTSKMMTMLKVWENQDFREYIDRFSKALAADAILPEDFA